MNSVILKKHHLNFKLIIISLHWVFSFHVRTVGLSGMRFTFSSIFHYSSLLRMGIFSVRLVTSLSFGNNFQHFFKWTPRWFGNKVLFKKLLWFSIGLIVCPVEVAGMRNDFLCGQMQVLISWQMHEFDDLARTYLFSNGNIFHGNNLWVLMDCRWSYSCMITFNRT